MILPLPTLPPDPRLHEPRSHPRNGVSWGEAGQSSNRSLAFGEPRSSGPESRQVPVAARLCGRREEWVVDDASGNYDHVAWVAMTDDGPGIANLPLDGILDEYGRTAPDAHRWRHEPD